MKQKIKITIEMPNYLCVNCEKEQIKHLKDEIKKVINQNFEEWSKNVK